MTVFAGSLFDPDGDTSDNTTCDKVRWPVRTERVCHG